jgi:hypothetical protein
LRAVAPSLHTSLNISFEPFYRVVLIYNGWKDDKDKDVAIKVKQSIDILSFGESLGRARTARQQSSAILVTVPKDDAHVYVENLVKKGLEAKLDEA